MRHPIPSDGNSGKTTPSSVGGEASGRSSALTVDSSDASTTILFNIQPDLNIEGHC